MDASALSPESHNSIWKGDREHLIETDRGRKYKSIIKRAIKESKNLKDLQKKIRKEETSGIVKKDDAKIWKNLVKNDKKIINLLKNKNPSIINNNPTPN